MVALTAVADRLEPGGDRGVVVAAGLQVGDDALAALLERDLVERALAVEGQEVALAQLGELGALNHDLDLGAELDREGDVDRAGVFVVGLGRGLDRGREVGLAGEKTQQPAALAFEPVGIVFGALAQPQRLAQLLGSEGLVVAGEKHLADPRPGPAFDPVGHLDPVLAGRPHLALDFGVEVAASPVELGQGLFAGRQLLRHEGRVHLQLLARLEHPGAQPELALEFDPGDPRSRAQHQHQHGFGGLLSFPHQGLGLGEGAVGMKIRQGAAQAGGIELLAGLDVDQLGQAALVDLFVRAHLDGGDGRHRRHRFDHYGLAGLRLAGSRLQGGGLGHQGQAGREREERPGEPAPRRRCPSVHRPNRCCRRFE